LITSNGQRISRDAFTGDPAVFLAPLAARAAAAGAARMGAGRFLGRVAGAVRSAIQRPSVRATASVVGGGVVSGVSASAVQRAVAGRRGTPVRAMGSGPQAGFRRRRMRVTNVRALGRALRRVEGFERVARRVLRITAPRLKVRGFKRKPRRRR